MAVADGGSKIRWTALTKAARALAGQHSVTNGMQRRGAVSAVQSSQPCRGGGVSDIGVTINCRGRRSACIKADFGGGYPLGLPRSG